MQNCDNWCNASFWAFLADLNRWWAWHLSRLILISGLTFFHLPHFSFFVLLIFLFSILLPSLFTKTIASYSFLFLHRHWQYYLWYETPFLLIMIKMSATLLTHWGRGTHICVGKLIIIGSDNGLSPGRRQAIISTNAGILLIGPLGTNFSEILIEIITFSFNKKAFGNVVWKIAVILSRPQWVKYSVYKDNCDVANNHMELSFCSFCITNILKT